MQGLLLVLFAFRLVFLLGAAGLCVYGVFFMEAPLSWRLGYVAGFVLSLAMIWALWRSFRALRKG
jgi:hypothetical protein